MTSFFASHGINVLRDVPHATKKPQYREHHGRTFTDNYEWLRDKESEEVLNYVKAQNELTDKVTAHLSGLKQTLFHELKSRVQETDMSVPTRIGDYWYFARTEEGKQYGQQCRVPVKNKDDWTAPEVAVDKLLNGEEVVFDANRESQGHDFWRSGGMDLDKSGRFLVYSVDTHGDERYDVRVRDLNTGDDLPDFIERVSAGAFITPDGRWIFYVRTDDAWRPCEIWLHRVGQADSSADKCVWRENDERFWAGAGLSFDETMIIIETSSKTTSEVLHLPVADIEGLLREDDDPQAKRFEPFIPREPGVEYDVSFARFEGKGDSGSDIPVAIVVHNVNHPNFEIDIIDMSRSSGPYALGDGVCIAVGSDYGCENSSAQDRAQSVSKPYFNDVNPRILQGASGLQVGGLGVYKNFITFSYRADSLHHSAIITKDQAFEDWQAGRPWNFTVLGEDEKDVIPSVGFGSNPSYEAPVVRYGFSSYTRPSQLHELNPATGEDRLLKRASVRNYDEALYAERRVWVTVRDGVNVPVSLVWKKGLVAALDEMSGTLIFNAPDLSDMFSAQEETREFSGSPMFITGYGSYESSSNPGFSVARPSMLDRGVIFAVVHVRGGGEMGRAWYEQGRRLNKKNTFYDFVDTTAALQKVGIADPRRTVANGGSAGGLLMGAIANIAPFLYAGIEADVPFVDALTSILDESLPLTVTEWDEWGDPLHDPQVYDYMKSYTPYENVMTAAERSAAFGKEHFPVVFITTSMNDTRVLYVEPLKWMSRLNEPEVGAEAFAKIEIEAGHGGVSGRYKQWEEVSFENAWCLDIMGLA